jgi:hypothetical protein
MMLASLRPGAGTPGPISGPGMRTGPDAQFTAREPAVLGGKNTGAGAGAGAWAVSGSRSAHPTLPRACRRGCCGIFASGLAVGSSVGL